MHARTCRAFGPRARVQGVQAVQAACSPCWPASSLAWPPEYLHPIYHARHATPRRVPAPNPSSKVANRRGDPHHRARVPTQHLHILFSTPKMAEKFATWLVSLSPTWRRGALRRTRACDAPWPGRRRAEPRAASGWSGRQASRRTASRRSASPRHAMFGLARVSRQTAH